MLSSLITVFTDIREPGIEIRCHTAVKALSQIQTQHLISILKRKCLIPAKNIKAELCIYSKFDYPFVEIIIKELSPA